MLYLSAKIKTFISINDFFNKKFIPLTTFVCYPYKCLPSPSPNSIKETTTFQKSRNIFGIGSEKVITFFGINAFFYIFAVIIVITLL